MPPRGLTTGEQRALIGAFLAVAALEVGLLHAWRDPALFFDEQGYAALRDDWRRLALHNPGYGVVALLLEAPALIRVVQLAAGLLTGLVVFHALRRRVDPKWALAGAVVVWTHPSHLFFRLTLWPVALATALVAVVLLCVLRLAEDPDDPDRQWALGLAYAPLPFFAAPALALAPAALLWPGRRRAGRVLGPLLVVWLPWAAALSINLGTVAPMDLVGPCNVAMGNHPGIAADRGSLWGDREGRLAFEAERDDACADAAGASREEARCHAGWCAGVARSTIADAPGAALRRAALRVAETWRPGTFAVRHLPLVGRPDPRPLAIGLAVLHALIVLAALSGLRTREGRAAWLALALWTLPIALTVGFTRARQPLLPVLVFAAFVARGRERKP